MSHAMTFGDAPSADDKMWGLFAHLSSFVVPIFGSLLLYAIHKDKPFIAYHSAQSLGFQVAMWVAGAIIAVISTLTCGFGAVLYLVLIPCYLVPLWGAYQAYEGQWAGYPMIGQLGK